MSEQREALAEALRASGLSDRPDLHDSSIHSWRCEYPDRYGPCDCFEELVTDLARLLADAGQRGADRVAAAVEALTPMHLYEWPLAGEWLNRADVLAALTPGAAERVRAEEGGDRG